MTSEVQPRPEPTTSQAARRERVIRVALELAAEGGYEAVQMRDVAHRAEVALGTIYRYFTSKDALLAAVTVLWIGDLERQVARRPPEGATTVERIVDVIDRAMRALRRERRLGTTMVAALTAGDPAGVEAMEQLTGAMVRLLRSAFPPDVDPETEAAAARVIGHVWWSTTVAWANGMGSLAWVAEEVRGATELVAERFG